MRNQPRLVDRKSDDGASLYVLSSEALETDDPTGGPRPREVETRDGADPTTPPELEPASGLVLGLVISLGFWVIAVALLMVWGL